MLYPIVSTTAGAISLPPRIKALYSRSGSIALLPAEYSSSCCNQRLHCPVFIGNKSLEEGKSLCHPHRLAEGMANSISEQCDRRVPPFSISCRHCPDLHVNVRMLRSETETAAQALYTAARRLKRTSPGCAGRPDDRANKPSSGSYLSLDDWTDCRPSTRVNNDSRSQSRSHHRV